MRRPDLAEELLALAREDQAVRVSLAATGELFDGYHPVPVHERHRSVEDGHGSREEGGA